MERDPALTPKDSTETTSTPVNPAGDAAPIPGVDPGLIVPGVTEPTVTHSDATAPDGATAPGTTDPAAPGDTEAAPTPATPAHSPTHAASTPHSPVLPGSSATAHNAHGSHGTHAGAGHSAAWDKGVMGASRQSHESAANGAKPGASTNRTYLDQVNKKALEPTGFSYLRYLEDIFPHTPEYQALFEGFFPGKDMKRDHRDLPTGPHTFFWESIQDRAWEAFKAYSAQRQTIVETNATIQKQTDRVLDSDRHQQPSKSERRAWVRANQISSKGRRASGEALGYLQATPNIDDPAVLRAKLASTSNPATRRMYKRAHKMVKHSLHTIAGVYADLGDASHLHIEPGRVQKSVEAAGRVARITGRGSLRAARVSVTPVTAPVHGVRDGLANRQIANLKAEATRLMDEARLHDEGKGNDGIALALNTEAQRLKDLKQRQAAALTKQAAAKQKVIQARRRHAA